MRYTKPEITVANTAMDAISSGRQKINGCADANGSGQKNATCAAYEADE